MKTKAELIEKAMKAAKKVANGEHVVLKIGGKIYSSKALRGDAMPKQETWRERNLRRQAEGVKFECRPTEAADTDPWYLPREWRFDGNEEDYREYVPEPLPHAELRARYEKKLAAGEEVVVQVMIMGAWVDLGPKGKVSWLPGNIYRIKPKTKTIWFGLSTDESNIEDIRLCIGILSEADLIEHLAKGGRVPIGKIESREVGIES